MQITVSAIFCPEPNFGDRLTQFLLSFYGFRVVHHNTATAQLVGIGSILENIPSNVTGVILGSGFLWYHSRRSFPNAKFAAVRGRMTADRCNAPSGCVLGDPGLLVGRILATRPALSHVLGIIPHYVDQDAPEVKSLTQRHGNEVKLIDVRDMPEKVALEIASCQYILSSSLHGLVAADSFGIPNRWMKLSERVFGYGFKFGDYYSAFDEVRSPLILTGAESLLQLKRQMMPPPSAVPDRCEQLHEVFSNLETLL